MGLAPMLYLELSRWSRSKDKSPFCVDCKPEEPPFLEARLLVHCRQKQEWRTEAAEAGVIQWKGVRWGWRGLYAMCSTLSL